MNEKNIINGSTYLPVREAAKSAKFSTDYVARLCREGKVDAHRIGKNWYIAATAFERFVEKEKSAREVRRQRLAEEYARNRHALLHTNAESVQESEVSTKPQPAPSNYVHPALRAAVAKIGTSRRFDPNAVGSNSPHVFGNSLAVVFALCVVAGGWTFCAPPAARALVGTVAESVGGGFGDALRGNPDQTAIALDNAISTFSKPITDVAINVGNEELNGIAQVGNALTGYSSSFIYTPTDQNGLVGQATRTLDVIAQQSQDSDNGPNASSTLETDDASSSDATSTQQ